MLCRYRHFANSTQLNSTRRRVELSCVVINTPLDSNGNYSATSNNTKLVHWPLIGGLLHLVQRGGAWTGCGSAQLPPRCTKCNSPPINGQCTNHCIARLYDGLLLCGFNVAIKGLILNRHGLVAGRSQYRCRAILKVSCR